MQVVENKYLVIQTEEPQKILSTIAKSAEYSEDSVAVHWGLKEAQMLKRLGLPDVPSPIERDYKWPGLYKPMNHQKETASFLTLYQRAFCFNEQGTGKTASEIGRAHV